MTPKFPALGFGRDVGRYAKPGRERLMWFLGAKDFSTCTSWALKRGERLGMVVVDCDLQCWEVSAVIDKGIVGPVWERALRFVLRQSLHGIDQRIEEVGVVTLQQVKGRVAASIQANPDDWRDDEAIAGESAPPRDEQELLDELKASVLAATSVPQIINALSGEELEG